MIEDLLLIESHTVPTLFQKQRLQEYAAGIFRTINTRSGIKKAIKKGLITINDVKGTTGDWISGGEEIGLYESKISKKPIISLHLEILYEDDYLAILHKPAGVVVSGNKRTTIENALPSLLKPSSQTDGLRRPEPIHRLDYPTSGALLIGKTASVVRSLNKMFELKKIQKRYIAVTTGEMNDQGHIETPLEGKSSKTTYKLLEQIESPSHLYLNLVELTPHTGRTHQLRKHLFSIGFGIFGDPLYKEEGNSINGRGLYLHAFSLSFEHPISGQDIMVKGPIPKKFIKLFPQSLA